LSSLQGLLVGVHIGLAQLTGAPELALDPAEAEKLCTAAENVARHYSITTTQKTLDWIALGGVLAGVYLPRLYVIGQRRGSRRKAPEGPSMPPSEPGYTDTTGPHVMWEDHMGTAD